jgi:hypothetical protein
VGFETTISAFERAKTVHALDRAATVIGVPSKYFPIHYSIIILPFDATQSVLPTARLETKETAKGEDFSFEKLAEDGNTPRTTLLHIQPLFGSL